MKKKIKRAGKGLSHGDQKKSRQVAENIQRREAIKRIAYLTLGGIAGASVIGACEPPYEDYSDYGDYYSDYYSRYSNNYYDYYSVYSAYWD